MARLIDLSGSRFGRLTVTGKTSQRKNGQATWSCACDCGGVIEVRGNCLRGGQTESCGCLRSELLSGRNRKHGSSSDPVYAIWRSMRQRCTNPSSKHYKSYGGRGISVCAEWNSFEVFASDMGPRPPGFSIERLDVDGNYCPGNCVWASSRDQARNRTDNRSFMINGRRVILADAAAAAGVTRSCIASRLKSGWPESSALTLPKGSKRPPTASGQKEN